MRRSSIAAFCLSVLTIFGCDRAPAALSPLAPSADSASASISKAVVAAISGTWAGPTTSNTPASNGQVVVVFTPTPSAVNAAVTWTSARTSASYAGNVTGTMDNLVLVASSAQACSYSAKATLNAAGNEMSGTYAAAGTACRADAGTFVVTKQ
jgi:hypothetical protein